MPANDNKQPETGTGRSMENRLLILQHLDRRERQRMENRLNVQAVSVQYHWHLYPEIIDENCISTAKVQCRLQKANQSESSVR